jgi:hypothetical protein
MAERFRQFIFPPDNPRLSMIKGDYREHTEFMRHLTTPRGSVEDMLSKWAAAAPWSLSRSTPSGSSGPRASRTSGPRTQKSIRKKRRSNEAWR